MKQKMSQKKAVIGCYAFAPNQHIYVEELCNFTNNFLESNKVFLHCLSAFTGRNT